MSCVKCKEKSFINFGGFNYCCNCFNKMFRDDNIDLPINVDLTDCNNVIHSFVINYLIFSTLIRFVANEENGYEIEKGYKLDADLNDALYDFIKYAKKCINNKIITDNHLKSHGTIKINYDSFTIDDKKLSPYELQKLFSSYEGFHIDYRINDPSEEILTKDECLVKYELNKDILINEYCFIMNVLCNGKFLSYKNEYIFDYVFREYFFKLKGFYDVNSREASKVIKYIIDDIKSLETDCDIDIAKEKINLLEEEFYLYKLFLEE